jgi:hypothetical protein
MREGPILSGSSRERPDQGMAAEHTAYGRPLWLELLASLLSILVNLRRIWPFPGVCQELRDSFISTALRILLARQRGPACQD